MMAMVEVRLSEREVTAVLLRSYVQQLRLPCVTPEGRQHLKDRIKDLTDPAYVRHPHRRRN